MASLAPAFSTGLGTGLGTRFVTSDPGSGLVTGDAIAGFNPVRRQIPLSGI
jgi:hypothetical protein